MKLRKMKQVELIGRMKVFYLVWFKKLEEYDHFGAVDVY
jgi:hypothetical protein